MTTNEKLLFYPISSEKISGQQKEYLLTNYPTVTMKELEEYIAKRPTLEQFEDEINSMSSDEKLEIFIHAKSICEQEYISYEQLNALAELGNFLYIDSSKTGFSFDLYSNDERREHEFQRVLFKFSGFVSVVDFIPFSGVISYTLTTPIQLAMVNKIASIYDFELDAKKIISMATGTMGTSLVFKILSRILAKVLPFKWVWRMSGQFISTYSIGILAKAYIAADGELNADTMQAILESAKEEGAVVFTQFKDYIIKNKDRLISDLKASFAK